MQEASRSFQLGLKTLLAVRGQAGVEAEETRDVAMVFLMATAETEYGREPGSVQAARE